MTEEQAIISSGTPHEVHLPEGSHTAVHKTATPMEPTIRNTIAKPDEEVELVEIVQGVSKSQEDETRMAHAAQQAAAPDRVHHDEPTSEADRLVHDDDAHDESAQAPTTAQPLNQVMSDLPSLELGASDTSPDTPMQAATLPTDAPALATPAAQEDAVAADTVVAVDEVAPPAQFMEEMNFPARVVKLKMANDQVRGQIEKLEKPLFAPVPVEAPAAKGKDKEPAKKPAKGH